MNMYSFNIFDKSTAFILMHLYMIRSQNNFKIHLNYSLSDARCAPHVSLYFIYFMLS